MVERGVEVDHREGSQRERYKAFYEQQYARNSLKGSDLYHVGEVQQGFRVLLRQKESSQRMIGQIKKSVEASPRHEEANKIAGYGDRYSVHC